MSRRGPGATGTEAGGHKGGLTPLGHGVSLMQQPSPTRARRGLGHRAGFWVVAASFVVTLAFATVPTPLYRLYQHADAFPTLMITVIFAAYAVGVAAALYLVGHVSDWTGRRRTALWGVGAEVLAALVFLLSTDVPELLVARVLTGVGVGLLTPTVTAWLAELRSAGVPGSDPAVASTAATAGTSLGFGLGALVSGVVAARVGAPLVDPYAIFLAALVVVALALALVPETARRHHRRWAPQTLALPRSSPGLFVAACAGAVAAFAVFSTVTALAPTILATVMGTTSLAAAGTVPFALFGVAALSQVVTARTPRRTQLGVVAAFSTAGLALLALSAAVASEPLFVVALAVTGVGAGPLFRASVVTASAVAEPERRGAVLALFFLVAYVGLAFPAVLVGVALGLAPAVGVIVTFSAVVLAAVLAATAVMARRR